MRRMANIVIKIFFASTEVTVFQNISRESTKEMKLIIVLNRREPRSLPFCRKALSLVHENGCTYRVNLGKGTITYLDAR